VKLAVEMASGENFGDYCVRHILSKTTVGTRAQVDDMTSGTGCLLRWYPASRCGVVVLYNSATGGEAAERIAHIALGGD
jgi:hypothetical protein